MAGEAAFERIDLLVHRAGVGDDTARPFEHALALRGKAAKPRSALHQQHAKTLFQLLDAGRQGGLAHPAGFRRMPEMLLARQRDDEFQLVDHGVPA